MADDVDPALTSAAGPSHTAHRAEIILLLGVFSIVLTMYGLDKDGMHGDESQYALATRDILRNGQWLAPSPYPPVLWFHKPPAYMWLSAVTAPLFDDAPVRYRIWSATFAVVTVLVTALIAARAFGPVTALLAGLALITNHDLLYHHGAREGTMDTALMLCTTLVAWLVIRGPASQGWSRWAFVGALLGVMSLFKPLAGLPLLGLLLVHQAIAATGTMRARIRNLTITVGVMIVVGSPWYLLCAARYGEEFTQGLFGLNLIKRISEGMGGENAPWHFFLRQIIGGSPVFALSVVAVPYFLWIAWRHPNARLIAVIAVGWPILFSLSAGKMAQYIYPALPMIAIAIGKLLTDAGKYLSRRNSPRWRPIVNTAMAALMVVAGLIQLARHLFNDVKIYRPIVLYEQVAERIAAGQVSLAVVGLPAAQVQWRGELFLDARDCFYLEPLTHLASLDTPAAYADALRQGKPTFAIIAKSAQAKDSKAKLVHEAPAFVIEQHGLDEYLPRPIVSQPVTVESQPFAQKFTLTVNPPKNHSNASLIVDLKLNGSPGAIWWDGRLKSGRRVVGPWYLVPVPGGHQLFGRLTGKDWRRVQDDLTIEFTLRDTQNDAPVSGVVQGARLVLTPE